MSAVVKAALTAAVIVAIDQATKALVRANVRPGSEDGVFPGVQLVNSRNKGVAFNLLEGKPGVVTAITAAVVIGLLLGGAAGNVIDRVAREDGVTDFIKLPAWPAFNVADMAITFGVLALFYVLEGKRDDQA